MPPMRVAPFLILRDTVTEDLVIADWIVVDPAAISRVALHGVDDAILDFLNDTRMVGFSVLRTGRAVRIVPIEEDNHSRNRFSVSVCPLTSIFEPVDAVDAPRIFWDNA